MEKRELPEETKRALVVLCAGFASKYDVPIEEVIRFAQALTQICASIDDKEEVVH